ncbi:hypothetical protein J7E32_21665 [Bacillus sp. ISL-55]|nr:hypothetical protein [Bacillus sp. ISL-55]
MTGLATKTEKLSRKESVILLHKSKQLTIFPKPEQEFISIKLNPRKIGIIKISVMQYPLSPVDKLILFDERKLLSLNGDI